MQLKNQRSGSKAICGFSIILILQDECYAAAHNSKTVMSQNTFFVPFILSEGNFFNICVLSECIVCWIHF